MDWNIVIAVASTAGVCCVIAGAVWKLIEKSINNKYELLTQKVDGIEKLLTSENADLRRRIERIEQKVFN